jgi:hypothetical protein
MAVTSLLEWYRTGVDVPARLPASSSPITPSRLHSSLITARPAFGVSDGSGAPIRAC